MYYDYDVHVYEDNALLIHHKIFALKKENKEVRDNVHDVQM